MANRLAEKQQHLAQTVHAKVMVLVVGVDNRVQGLDGGQGLHGLVRSAKVGANLLAHGDQVGSGLLVVVLELVRQVVAKAKQLLIELVQVRLLLDKYGIVFIHKSLAIK